MKRIATLLIVLTTVGCSQTKVDKKAEGDKVMQVSREWSQTIATKDVDKTVSYWADDAFLMQDGQPPLKVSKPYAKW